jgi:hypothetical protein
VTEVIAVAVHDAQPSGEGDAPVAGHGVDLSGLPPAVADRLVALLAAVDAVTDLGATPGVSLDGPQAAAVAAVVGHGISRLAITQARMVPVVEADGLWAALAAITPIPAVGDTRGADQRRAHALGDPARVVLDHGLAGSGRATGTCSDPVRRSSTRAGRNGSSPARVARRSSLATGTADIPAATPHRPSQNATTSGIGGGTAATPASPTE